MATPIDPIDEGPVERQEFFRRLLSFHENRGTPIQKMPILGKREVDLFELFERVQQRGGIREVVLNRKWPEIVKLMPLPKTCTNAGFSLKLLYQRYLLDYERVFVHHQPDVPPGPVARGGMPIPDYLPENVALPDPFLGAARVGAGDDAGDNPAPERARKRGRADANHDEGGGLRQQHRTVSTSNISANAGPPVNLQLAALLGAVGIGVDTAPSGAGAEDPLAEEEEEAVPEVVLKSLSVVSKRLDLSLSSVHDADVDWALSTLLVQTRKKIPVFATSRTLLDRITALLLTCHTKATPLECLMGTFFNSLSFDGALRRSKIVTILVNGVALEENLRTMTEHSGLVAALFAHLLLVPFEIEAELHTRLDIFIVLDAVIARGTTLSPSAAVDAVRVLLGEMEYRDLRRPLCVAALAKLLRDRDVAALMAPHLLTGPGGLDPVVGVLAEALHQQSGEMERKRKENLFFKKKKKKLFLVGKVAFWNWKLQQM